MDIKALREEFATLHTASNALISTAATAKRTLTGEEKASNDQRYDRMKVIHGQIEEQRRFASLALEAGTETIVIAADPIGRSEYDRSEGRKTFKDAAGNFDLIGYKRAMRQYALTGDTRQLFTVTSGTQSGAFLPKEVLQPVTVRRLQNCWRAILAAGGYEPIEVDSTASFSIPVADDTANIGQQTSESSTSVTSLDPSNTGSINISPTLYDSKAFFYSNTLVNTGTFDVIAYTLPMAQKRIEKDQETTWTTNVLTNGSVGVTTASASAIVYAELLTWEHSLAPAYRTDAVFALSDSLYKALRGLVDNNNRPIIDLDPQGVFMGKIHGRPIVIGDYFQTMAANHICGAFVSASAIKIVDVMNARLARYSNLPQYPDQVGFEMFQNGDFGFITNGLSLIKTAIS